MGAELAMWESVALPRLRPAIGKARDQEVTNSTRAAARLIELGHRVEFHETPSANYGDPSISDLDKIQVWRKYCERMPDVLASLQVAIKDGEFDPATEALMHLHLTHEETTFAMLDTEFRAFETSEGSDE